MDMIRISADEEKPALELTPETISAIKEDSSKTLPELEIAKQKFIEQAKSLKPSTDKEILDQLWNDYTSSIKALPKTSHETFPDYETWFEENKYNLVNWFNEHLKTPKVEDPFQKIISETGVDPESYIKEKIAPGMYQRSLALDKFQTLGITPAKQSENPVIAFNSLMDSYSAQLKNLPYNWGTMFLPHDGQSKDFKHGISAEDIMRKLGWDIRIVPKQDIESGIKLARMNFHRIYFDKSANRLVECLKNYRRSINSATNEPGAPLHDEFSHGADAFRYLCTSIESMKNESWSREKIQYTNRGIV